MHDTKPAEPLDFLPERAASVGARFGTYSINHPPADTCKARGGVPVYRNGKHFATFVDREHALAFINGADRAHNPMVGLSYWSTTALESLLQARLLH